MIMVMKEVVILGGGFAGVAAVYSLLKKHPKNTRVTLIDKNTFHTFTPSLYETATAEQPKKNIAIPLRAIFPRRVVFVKAEIAGIDDEKKVVQIKDGEDIPYDYLIITLGSQTNFYHIPGLEEYGLPLKSVKEALEIKKKIHEVFYEKNKDGTGMRVLIGGGGFSGTEFAGELISYRHKLCGGKEHKVHQCMRIGIVQGSNMLLNELDSSVSKIAEKRVKEGGVELLFGGHIAKVTKDAVIIDNGKEYLYDILVWTGGIKANPIIAASGFPLNHHGQIQVDEFLRVRGTTSVFAAGDIAEYIDPISGKPAPGVAQVAEEEGKIAGENVARHIKGQFPVMYHYRHFGYVVPLHGKYAVADLGRIKLSGIWGWFLQQLVFLRYLLGIMPITKAFVRFNTYELELMDND